MILGRHPARTVRALAVLEGVKAGVVQAEAMVAIDPVDPGKVDQDRVVQAGFGPVDQGAFGLVDQAGFVQGDQDLSVRESRSSLARLAALRHRRTKRKHTKQRTPF